MTTSELFDATNKALCEGAWGTARALLDDLGLRNDNRDLLCNTSAYGLTGAYAPVIQDRIDLVNSKALLVS